VLGAGPVGRAIVAALATRGHHPIVVTRSGTAVDGATARIGDLNDPASAVEAVADATIVFSAAQPEYHRWAEEFPALQASIVAACIAAGAPLMVVENLYGYGRPDGPLAENTPMQATTKKGKVRIALWNELQQASDQGALKMAVVRASDFIGPGVDGSAFGGRFFGPLTRGKPAQMVGDPDALHSVTFVPDVAEALVRVAEDEESWGRAWHVPTAPAVTQRQLAELAGAAVGRPGAVKVAPVWMLRLLGLFVAPVRETIEMLYEFEEDFVIDSSAFTDRFGMDATPLDRALAEVMASASAGRSGR
jgi:nucleoside-diphosphate-sugar epimerase